MKVLILSMGSGETAQGADLARILIEQNREVVYGLIMAENRHFLDSFKVPIHILPTPSEFLELVSAQEFDYIIFCNSKTYKHFPNFRKNRPKVSSKFFSLDSNWLFNENVRYPYIEWLDKYFVNFTEEIFSLGLVENGGHYQISPQMRRKILPVGFIPENQPLNLIEKLAIRRELGIAEDEKVIFSYFGSGTTRILSFEKIFLDYYFSAGLGKCKLIQVSESNTIDERVINIKKPNAILFYKILAASDQVVQHQGMGTLEQAIAANVPVINLVVPADPGEQVNAGEWEVDTFDHLGLCKKIRITEIDQLFDTIKELLYGKSGVDMVERQKLKYIAGSNKLITEAEKIVTEAEKIVGAKVYV